MKRFLILLLTALVVLPSAFSRNSRSRTLYHLHNPDRKVLTAIERSGGIVDHYLPGEPARVYLSDTLADQLRSLGYKLDAVSPAALAKITVEQLSEDHRIGYSYHSYEAVSFILDSLAGLYPHLCQLSSIGQTVQGREMWVMMIKENPHLRTNEPRIKLIGAIHGNETITQELMLHLIEYLLQYYTLDPRVEQLLRETEIWILPNMNFDGTQVQSRFNANNVDLNRNFPDRDAAFINPDPLQPETMHVMDWSAQQHFTLAANFHSGALLANYPWDKNLNGQQGYAATPDDSTFRRLALSYSRNNLSMYASTRFEKGISNGAMWYEISGSMQDWNYHFQSAMELTIEMSEVKTPAADSIPYYWLENREAMLTFMEQVYGGLRGTVSDSLTGEALPAQITVFEIGKPVFTRPESGQYYRLLEEGHYSVRIEAEGYCSKVVDSVIITADSPTTLHVLLTPIPYYTFSGMVHDSLTGSALAQAQLILSRDGQPFDSTLCDDEGRFAFVLPEGAYDLVIRKPGYRSFQDSLSVFAEVQRNFALLKFEPAVISGTIQMMDSGSPLGTVVYCQGRTDTLQTDNYFRIDSLLSGAVNLFAYKFDYKTSHVDTFVQDGDSLFIGIVLWPGSNEFFSNFEAGDPLFSGSGDWQFGITPGTPVQSYSGDHVWATVLDGNYSSGAHLHQLETPIFSIQGFVVPVLEFFHYYDIEENYDGGNVKVSADEGKTWQIIYPDRGYSIAALPADYGNPMTGQAAYSGKSKGWEQAFFDLSAFIDQPFLKFRFDFGTDEQKEAAGWYIDDFHLFDANATPLTTQKFRLDELDFRVNIFPNPANSEVIIDLHSTVDDNIRIFIYNSIGQLMFKKEFPIGAGQPVRWIWQGVNQHNLPLASGLYFVQLHNKNQVLREKVVLIK